MTNNQDETNNPPEDPPSNNDGDTNQEEEDLAAMMAFQEEEIVFINDNDDDEDDDSDDGEEHPNANNPAALALRARMQQNRQRAGAAPTGGVLRKLSSSLRYAPLSFLSAFLLIFHTMRTRQQFYLTVIYLQSSKLSYVILGNATIALGVSTFSLLTKMFLGGLRVNERDAIGEHIRWDVTETCLALTIFRSEMDVGTAVMFLGLVVMKCLHWSIELRGGHLRMTEEVLIYPEEFNDTTATNNTQDNQRKKLPWYKRLPHFRMSHIKFYSLLYILTILDIVAVAHCALSVATDGPSVSILFGFEFAILLVTALCGMLMYHVHVVDGFMGFLHHCAEGEHHYNAVGALAEPAPGENVEGVDGQENVQGASEAAASNDGNATSTTSTTETPPPKTLAKTLVERLANPWKNRRATISFAIELQAQAAKFLFYCVFFAIVFTYYGMPINIFREVYVSFQQLRRRLIAFNNYRRLTHNMETRFESIEDEAELDRLGHTCIICRDSMDLSGGCKKLPMCGHAFHTHCLREWLVQQQSCPTCRADIAANEARMKREREAAAAAADGAEEEANEQQENGVENEGGITESREVPAADGEQSDAVQQKQEEQLTTNKSNETTSTAAQPESTSLPPGWEEAVDSYSNKTYYYNSNTNQSTWEKPTTSQVEPTVHNDVLSQFNALLDEHNANRDEQVRQRDTLHQHQNESALTNATLTNNTPCLYRITNPLGAHVLERHSSVSKRIIPQGKIIVCTSVEYWPELGGIMYVMPDGYVSPVDVEKFLELDGKVVGQTAQRSEVVHA